MSDILEALKDFGNKFVNETGLTLIRTLAFLVLGLVVIKIVQTITRNVTLKSSKLDNSAGVVHHFDRDRRSVRRPGHRGGQLARFFDGGASSRAFRRSLWRSRSR